MGLSARIQAKLGAAITVVTIPAPRICRGGGGQRINAEGGGVDTGKPLPNIMTRATTLIVMALLIPGVALAQEANETNADESWRALVWVKDGNGELIEKVRATPQFALDAILAEEPWGKDAARKVLGQFGEARSATELDAFADALGRLVLESPSSRIARTALSVLSGATRDNSNSPQIPYGRGLDVLIQVYETMDGTEAVSARSLWSEIIGAGGEDYIMNLFASSERPEAPCAIQPYTPNITYWAGSVQEPVEESAGPPPGGWCPNVSQWCKLGFMLGRRKVGGVDLEHVLSICDKRRKVENGKLQLGIYW